MITFEPLWETMREKSITKYRLVRYHFIARNTLDRMKRNEAVTTTTINDVCKALNCDVSDVMRYIPDDEK